MFLEALEQADPGDVLVVDNEGRLDESCVGDLVAREVKGAGLAGMVIWGLHRDNPEVAEIGLPLFSLGLIAAGPQRLDPRPPDTFDVANVGPHQITSDDIVVADEDGVLFASRAGYDPAACLSFMQRLASMKGDTNALASLYLVARSTP